MRTIQLCACDLARPQIFEGLQIPKQLLLIGNGMHIPTLVSWFLFVVGHMRLRSEGYKFCLQVDECVETALEEALEEQLSESD